MWPRPCHDVPASAQEGQLHVSSMPMLPRASTSADLTRMPHRGWHPDQNPHEDASIGQQKAAIDPVAVTGFIQPEKRIRAVLAVDDDEPIVTADAPVLRREPFGTGAQVLRSGTTWC